LYDFGACCDADADDDADADGPEQRMNNEAGPRTVISLPTWQGRLQQTRVLNT
jgi:hypothetical protein